jgi:hypothetical protein
LPTSGDIYRRDNAEQRNDRGDALDERANIERLRLHALNLAGWSDVERREHTHELEAAG